MKTKDEIYRIFFLIDILKKDYLDSEAKPSRKKLEQLAATINANEQTRDINDKGDKGIGYKTLERLFNYENKPWDISYRSLNYITRFTKNAFIAEFSATFYINEIKKEVEMFKVANKDTLEEIFQRFEKYKASTSSKERIKYDFNIAKKQLNNTAKETINQLESSQQHLEEKKSFHKKNGIEATLKVEQLEQLKEHLTIWGTDKINELYQEFIEGELKKIRKIYKIVILLNSFGLLGFYLKVINKEDYFRIGTFNRLLDFLDNYFNEVYKVEAQEWEQDGDQDNDDTVHENDTSLVTD